MSIKSIDLVIKIKGKNSEFSRIIRSSIEPDNVAASPMKINSKCEENLLTITVKNIRGNSPPSTALATVDDLLKSYQLSEDILNQLVFSLS